MAGVELVLGKADVLPGRADGLRGREEALETKVTRLPPLPPKQVEVLQVEDPAQKLAELLEQYPYAQQVQEKFNEAIYYFERAEKAGKLKTDYDSPEGPTIGLASTSRGMMRLEEKGSITKDRREEGRATLAQLAFTQLYIEDSLAVGTQFENKTLEILNALEAQYIAERPKEHPGEE
jgi:hypothetical protein